MATPTKKKPPTRSTKAPSKTVGSAQTAQVAIEKPQLILKRPDAGRDQIEHSEHDKVLATVLSEFGSGSNLSYGNPNNQRKHPVKANGRTYYPDVVVTNRRSNEITKIFEVETKGALTASEARQWFGYSKLGLEFHLIVPHEDFKEARMLCEDFAIICQLGTYQFVKGGLLSSSRYFIKYGVETTKPRPKRRATMR
jgi:hypothetical protein